ncbi:hypothetical protein D9619_010534 [Psilocybe cf. subviscida]|uniref:Protein kinase domain-containing protein n=1 Tax=Psilocybe cf. subviscida TaxID=2480587 RepID=A0A8H5APJ1_9AGAR|nr:hypothetical protein D9619_013604 [Psilocybe cf. subviscida]KAF5310088.1 hypothetical protein D9619_010534 [Psilocybe cf. subviscida]
MPIYRNAVSDPPLPTWSKEREGTLFIGALDIINKQYEMMHFIASGSSGEVWKAYARETDRVLAVKMMKLPGFSVRAARAVDVASRLMSAGSIELFCELLGKGVYKNHHFLVFELQGASLAMFLSRPASMVLLQQQKDAIILQIINGVNHLHTLDMNVLQDVRIKIVDLEDTRTLIAKSTAFVGTIGYTPPEVYCGIGWGFSLDVYSFGCVMYEIQYGRRFMPDFPQVNASFAFLERAIGPFKPMLVKEIREHCDFLFTDDTKRPRVQVSRQYARLVNAEVGSFRDILRNHISNGSHAFKCLMVRCLNADSRVRPTAEDCVKHLQIQADGSLPPVDETMAE